MQYSLMSAPEFVDVETGGCAGRDFDCGDAAPAGCDCDCMACWVSRAAPAAIVQRTKDFVLMKFSASLLLVFRIALPRTLVAAGKPFQRAFRSGMGDPAFGHQFFKER